MVGRVGWYQWQLVTLSLWCAVDLSVERVILICAAAV